MKRCFAARLGLALVAATLGLTWAPPSAVRAAVDVGYKDQSFSGASGSPSGSKPESKLWWNDGVWWASMFDTVSGDFHIFRLNLATQAWIDTGTLLDPRSNSRADTLWDAANGKLYVASHVFASDSSKSATGNPSRLYRFGYNAATKTYSLDPGFPVAINGVSSETLVIDKDTTGTLWATWMQQSTLYVNRTTTDDLHWGTPFVPTVSGTAAAVDDISSVIAFGPGKIGVMWSNQNVSAMYFAYHVDGDPDTSWQASRTAVQGPNTADDHINLKSLQSDGSGRVYAAIKTSLSSSNAPLINLLVRDPATGDWASYVYGRVSDSHTRPIVMLDEEHGILHMYATGPTPPNTSGQSGGTIYEKTTPIDNISFPTGYGTPVIQDASSSTVNNVTSTKQNVNSTTGIVILATSDTTRLYYHNYISLGPPPAGPTADFVGSPTSGSAPLSVSFTDRSLGSPTSWSWNFGDPGSGTANTSTLQNPSHTYSSPGAYAVSLTVTDANDVSDNETRTDYITVNAPPGVTLTLGPVADAQVYSGQVNTNYGSLTSMRTREGNGSSSATYRSYVKFDVQGLTGSVTGVTLRLYVTDKSNDTQSVFAVDPSWTESDISYANAPAIGGSPLGEATAPNVNTYLDLPLATSAVTGNGTVSFAIRNSGTDSGIYSTKEAGTNPPRLVITQSASSTAPSANQVSVTTAQDTPVGVTLAGSDPETCELTFSIVSPPANGSLGPISDAACAPGSPNTDTASVTYTPHTGYSGPDSFTYLVNDGTVDSAPASVALTVTGSSAVTTTFTPGADAQVNSGNPTNNYGTLTSMRVREGSGPSTDPIYRSYVQFTVAGLSGTVTGVMLRLYVTDTSPNNQTVYAVSSSWTETGITYNNAPAIGGSPLGGAQPSTVNTYVEIDLGAAAVAGNGTVSFAIKSSGTDSAIYSTKEAGTSPPQLVITYTP